MIAKITHSYAVATLGEDLFSPLLTSFIRKQFGRQEEYPDCYHLVGGFPELYQPSPSLHQIALNVQSIDGQKHLLGATRLFGNLGAPVFVAVVGILNVGVTETQVLARLEASKASVSKPTFD